MTALDLITRALNKNGILAIEEPMRGDLAQRSLAELNAMIGQWQIDEGMIFATPPEVFSLAGGTPSDSGKFYTIGPGSDFVAVRPVKIERANIMATVDGELKRTELEVLTKDEWSMIEVPSLASADPPVRMWYDAEFTAAAPKGVGKIYLHPVSSAVCKLEIFPWQSLQTYPALTTEAQVPPGYEEAMVWNLALRTAVGILDPESDIVMMSANTLQSIRRKNQPEWWEVPLAVRAQQMVAQQQQQRPPQ